MRWAMNDSMASIFRGIGPAFPLEMLPPELVSLAKAGVLRSEGRVHLAMSQVKTAPPEDFDDYSAECWSNEVHLESQLPPSNPAWRSELVAWGVTVAERLLRMAPDITGLPVQATLSLASAPGKEDPEADHASGALHLYCVRTSADDSSSSVDQFGQPVLVLTVE